MGFLLQFSLTKTTTDVLINSRMGREGDGNRSVLGSRLMVPFVRAIGWLISGWHSAYKIQLADPNPTSSISSTMAGAGPNKDTNCWLARNLSSFKSYARFIVGNIVKIKNRLWTSKTMRSFEIRKIFNLSPSLLNILKILEKWTLF